MSTFDKEIIQTGLYISIKIPRPNYLQNFSRAKDTCYYVYLKPGICILSKQVTQLYLYLTYIFKGKNPLSNEKNIGECPNNSPFLKNNGAEAPKGPRSIVFKGWRDTRTFSNLKSTHCTLLILLIINLVTKKSLCISI